MIGISTNLLTERLPKTITSKRYHLSIDYVQAVTEAGAISCMLPILDPEQASEVIEECEGLVLSGGEDISSQFYTFQQVSEQPSDYIVKRDLFELALCREALKQKKPILGICRGAQLLNIALGGTLIQELKDYTKSPHIQKIAPEMSSHEVTILPKTYLSRIFQTSTIGVNSYHHQAIEKLGNQLKISAVSEDGIVEAIEYTGMSFAVGVQWHPEIMASSHKEQMDQLFHAFVEETKRNKQKGPHQTAV